MDALAAYRQDCSDLMKETGAYRDSYSRAVPISNEGQHAARNDFGPVSARLKSLAKQVDILHKLVIRVLDFAAKELGVKNGEHWDSRTINRLRRISIQYVTRSWNNLESRVISINTSIGCIVDFRMRNWSMYQLVKLVDRSDIKANAWSLTPGRYVGVAPPDEDEEFDFEEALLGLHVELEGLNSEAAELAATIKENFEELGI